MAALASPLTSSRALLFIFIAAVALAADVMAQAAPEEKPLPNTALAAAKASPNALARKFAELHVPAGFVMLADADAKALPPPFKPPRRVTIGIVLKGFVAAHPGYAIDQTGSAVLIRPKRPTVCDGLLGVPVGPFDDTDTVSDIALSLVRAETSKSPQRALRGTVGSVLSRPEDPVVIRQPPIVSLSLPERVPFRTALDRLIAVVPGSVWILQEHETFGRPMCSFRLIHGDGTGYTISSDLTSELVKR